MHITFPAFMEDSRGDRLKSHLITSRDGRPERYLYLLGPESAARQVIMATRDDCAKTPVIERFKREYSHRLVFPGRVPNDVLRLVDLLKVTLSLRTRRYVDAALALDWYTKVDEDLPSHEWQPTEAGRLVKAAKYAQQGEAKQKLLDWTLDTVEAHPLLRDTPTVVTVPGHEGNGNSFGERLARRVAQDMEKRVINTRSRGPQEQSKTGSAHEYGDFEIQKELEGDVLIVDDVYRSGMSMSVAARAAKQAGADRVFGLVVARTLRN